MGEPANSPETAVTIAQRVRAGTLDAADVVESTLDRIARHDDVFHAFVDVHADEARAAAVALDRAPDRAEFPLAGVPVAIKDVVPMAGHTLREGSAAAPMEPATTDHPVVTRLRQAGAILVGRTAVPELCVWGTTDVPGRITRNPRNPAYTAGGSSGGAGAAVAAGMVPLAHGTDGLGSIRIPAANCGVFGIKPGRGLVPSELGANSWFGMGENGVLATTVGDAALMLSVLAAEPGLADVATPEPLRVGIAPSSPSPVVSVDERWSAAAHDAGSLLADLGHRTTPTRLPYPVDLLPLLARWTLGTAADAEEFDDELLQPRTRRHIGVGRMLRSVNPRSLDRLEAAFSRVFEGIDLVVTPTLLRPGPAAIAWSEKSWVANMLSNVRYASFTPVWNLLGWPAASVPFGVHPVSRTPTAVQIAGPPGAESAILGLAGEIERARAWERVADLS
ncbi:amidase [Rhodococcus triatomae]|uniref:amidase n=1 Tax=Rhodococcus triatomae TaxID=300028 RepID=A0A1G8RZ13_9NOCA|nr:amidase [Rhodococcus triatomae]QNG17361.1 amidase [Rhodococcus triatomae]QNG22972.1 amidase [Rhodococcus triatomae]SDJ22244.1 amidase [Rhodococcus triatomae]